MSVWRKRIADRWHTRNALVRRCQETEEQNVGKRLAKSGEITMILGKHRQNVGEVWWKCPMSYQWCWRCVLNSYKSVSLHGVQNRVNQLVGLATCIVTKGVTKLLAPVSRDMLEERVDPRILYVMMFWIESDGTVASAVLGFIWIWVFRDLHASFPLLMFPHPVPPAYAEQKKKLNRGLKRRHPTGAFHLSLGGASLEHEQTLWQTVDSSTSRNTKGTQRCCRNVGWLCGWMERVSQGSISEQISDGSVTVASKFPE